MGHHTGVSTSDVVTQGIVDEGILILKRRKDFEIIYTNIAHV